MPERFGDLVAIFMSALAVGYVVYEIERRRRKMYDIWNVLDEEDAILSRRNSSVISQTSGTLHRARSKRIAMH